MKMKYLGLLAFIPAILAGCSDETDPSEINSGTRISLSKSPVRSEEHTSELQSQR